MGRHGNTPSQIHNFKADNILLGTGFGEAWHQITRIHEGDAPQRVVLGGIPPLLLVVHNEELM